MQSSIRYSYLLKALTNSQQYQLDNYVCPIKLCVLHHDPIYNTMQKMCDLEWKAHVGISMTMFEIVIK